MTINELRQHNEYQKATEKIKNYSKGFKFTMNYSQIPTAKANALKIIMKDCEENGLIESISMGLDLMGNLTEETFVRK